MKEIKFRAWDSYQKKMYTWNEIIKADIDGNMSLSNLLNGFIQHIKPSQYTNLKDKNGVEIYNSDIIKCTYGSREPYSVIKPYTAIVELDKVNPCFVLHKIGTDFYEYDFVCCGHLSLEIIGNIYENKDLIKDK